MGRQKPKALLIGEWAQGSSHLARRLEGRGCECSFATSCREALALLRSRELDLVLSPIRLHDGALYPIMDLLEGSGTTVFYFHAVEQGCWWLPGLRCGQKCFGSPALHGSEFVILLDETIKQIQRSTLATAEKRPLLIGPARSSIMLVPSPTITRSDRKEQVKRRAAG